ncbi:putative reverse transcriptase domain-containing protein [Tanacetum coccineum]|uniref:Reverse transcriptase domain-containing protein n=1 Tax=Tanacetum coccineum TaxID=301880 RepID=A0ABQ4YJY1_9ASTR
MKSTKSGELKTSDILIVRDLPKVFPEDLSRLPPQRQIEFRIDLVPGATMITKSPYRSAPSEMQDFLRKDHEVHLKLVLEQLKKEKLFAKFSKCDFGYNKYIFSSMWLIEMIAKPHTTLTHNNQKYEWGVKQEEAFQTLKDKLCNAPILSLPDGSKDFVVYCDASTQIFGCVLMQRGKTWRHYLYGMKNVIYTDHKSLQYIFDQKELNMCQIRWIELFSDYDCEIRYHPRKSSIKDKFLAAQNEASKEENTPTEMLSGLDQQMKKKEDRGMYFTDRILVPLVGDVRKMIMDEVHTMKYLIHPGADKMYYDLRDMYWWPCIERDVATYVMRETSDKVVLIKERLKEARDCQKSYADNWRKPLEFEVGDRVLLKMSPWKGTVRFRKKHKLALRYVGPFEILERIGEHSEVKEVKMRDNVMFSHVLDMLVVKLKDHIWALFFCIPELDLETGGLKIIKNDADVHALYDLAEKHVISKVMFTEMYCHKDEGFEHCPPLNDDEVGKDYLVPRSCDFDNKCMNNASKILESMNNGVEGIIQSVEGIIQSVEGMNDATNCVSIDKEVLARQNKLDKGKRPMTYDGIVTSKKRKNVRRGNGVSIRENDNHVLSNNESESEDNVDEYAHMYFNSESDESDKSFVCLIDDKEGPTKAEEDTCNYVDIADVDDIGLGLTLLVRKHEKYIEALFNEIKRKETIKDLSKGKQRAFKKFPSSNAEKIVCKWRCYGKMLKGEASFQGNAKNFALNEGDVSFQDHYGYLRSYAKALADLNEVSTVKVASVVVTVKDQENWSWFLDLVADDLKLPNGNGLTIMSD